MVDVVKRQAMVAAYLSGKDMAQAGAEVGMSREACRRALMEEGVQPRPKGLRKHEVDHGYFDEIQDEARAYWLGFLAADGYVGQRGVVLQLQERDADHVLAFRQALGAGHKITRLVRSGYGVFPSMRCKVTSVRLQRALEAKGIGKGAARGVRPWECVPAQLLRHYWRGQVDGDGCVRVDEDGQVCVYLCGLEEDLRAFARWARPLSGSRSKPREEHDRKLWTIRYGGNKVAGRIVMELYEGATVALARKMAVYEGLHNAG